MVSHTLKYTNTLASTTLLLLTFFFSSVSIAVELSQGAKLYNSKGCSACHTLAGEGGQVGPSLDDVGNRYNPTWLFTWLKNPAAVKPGTNMPNLQLTDEERAHLVFFLASKKEHQNGVKIAPTTTKKSTMQTPDRNPDSPENDYLSMGTESSYIKTQRFSLQDQIQSFIPPLYEPAFTQAAFVLPPGALRTSFTHRNIATMHASDVAGQAAIGSRFVDFDLKRNITDLDLFFGLDNNYTVRVNLPLLDTHLKMDINPAFLDPIKASPKGDYSELGDISIFLKKKFLDQGNFPVAIAGVLALRIPTGAADLKFEDRTLVTTPIGTGVMALPQIGQQTGMPMMGTGDGTFRRFTDDGQLASPLQPGLGTLGGSVGIFATRILDGAGWMGKGAIHLGGLYEIRPKNDGVDPGNITTIFSSFVKPVYKDFISVDLSYVWSDQEKDSYDGLMAVPTGMMPPAAPIMIANRRPFSGGTTELVGLSVIAAPNPLFKITLSAITRVGKPDLGPSPADIIRLSFQYTFASGLFQ